MNTLLEIVDQLAKLQQASRRATAERPSRLRIADYIPEGNAELVGSISATLNRGFTDAPLGTLITLNRLTVSAGLINKRR